MNVTFDHQSFTLGNFIFNSKVRWRYLVCDIPTCIYIVIFFPNVNLLHKVHQIATIISSSVEGSMKNKLGIFFVGISLCQAL